MWVRSAGWTQVAATQPTALTVTVTKKRCTQRCLPACLLVHACKAHARVTNKPPAAAPLPRLSARSRSSSPAGGTGKAGRCPQSRRVATMVAAGQRVQLPRCNTAGARCRHTAMTQGQRAVRTAPAAARVRTAGAAARTRAQARACHTARAKPSCPAGWAAARWCAAARSTQAACAAVGCQDQVQEVVCAPTGAAPCASCMPRA